MANYPLVNDTCRRSGKFQKLSDGQADRVVEVQRQGAYGAGKAEVQPRQNDLANGGLEDLASQRHTRANTRASGMLPLRSVKPEGQRK